MRATWRNLNSTVVTTEELLTLQRSSLQMYLNSTVVTTEVYMLTVIHTLEIHLNSTVVTTEGPLELKDL